MVDGAHTSPVRELVASSLALTVPVSGKITGWADLFDEAGDECVVDIGMHIDALRCKPPALHANLNGGGSLPRDQVVAGGPADRVCGAAPGPAPPAPPQWADRQRELAFEATRCARTAPAARPARLPPARRVTAALPGSEGDPAPSQTSAWSSGPCLVEAQAAQPTDRCVSDQRLCGLDVVGAKRAERREAREAARDRKREWSSNTVALRCGQDQAARECIGCAGCYVAIE